MFPGSLHIIAKIEIGYEDEQGKVETHQENKQLILVFLSTVSEGFGVFPCSAVRVFSCQI